MHTIFTALWLVAAAAAGAQPGDAPPVVINEILFNPRPGGSDYVELYNRSNQVVDLSTLLLANRNASGVYGSLKKLCDTARYLMPEAFVVFTEDAATLALHYFVKDPAAIMVLPALPSFPNTGGTVALLDTAKNVVDEVTYSDTWQFELLADADGVALERIDPDGKSNDKTNWRSAASDAGYGTPGYQNSNYKLFQNAIARVALMPDVFSPDGDGTDDVTTLMYAMPESGFVANVFIYDAAGRPVRHLAKNALLGTTGTFTWNGLDEKGNVLAAGHYIFYTELFTMQGRKQRFKNVVVLARRL